MIMSYSVHHYNVFCYTLQLVEYMSSCIEGSVTVVSDVYNSSLQLVEMCSSEGVWSPVCDNN